MSDKTKAVNLTEDEIIALIMTHGREMDEDNLEATLERINYLHRRLKTFKEPDTEVKSDNSATGWGTSNG
jgi:hypothetical protein